MRWIGVVVVVLGCGRVGFDPVAGGSGDRDARDLDGSPQRDGSAGDMGCVNGSLGSTTGVVAMGTTTGGSDRYQSCDNDGIGSPDVSYVWAAPAAGTYDVSLCGGPDPTFDSVLTVLAGRCTGAQVACADDGCGSANGLSRVSVPATAGQVFVIVVDGFAADGSYTLSINLM